MDYPFKDDYQPPLPYTPEHTQQGVLPPQLVTQGTASAYTISQQVGQAHIDLYNESNNTMAELQYAQPKRVRPGSNPVGQYTPVGDSILPLIAIALTYGLWKVLRTCKHKTNKIQ